MQNNPDAWKQRYDDFVQTKIDRLRSLSPDALVELRASVDRAARRNSVSLDRRSGEPKGARTGETLD